jgi:seryl-tRNA(Sec) selenium transferase
MDYVNRMAVSYKSGNGSGIAVKRGSRYVHVEELLRRITGAEAALVVKPMLLQFCWV